MTVPVLNAGKAGTVGFELQRAAEELGRAGVDEPRREAGILMAVALGIDRAAVWTHPERPLNAVEYRRWRRFLARRASREPLAYITGEKEFFGRSFIVTPAVLVPRPETEVLVQAVLDRLPGGLPLRVADVGTGAGVVAVTVACERPSYYVLATDISAAACDVAHENARRHRVDDRVYVFTGSLLEPVAHFWPLDAVVANLPYVPSTQMSTLPPEVSRFEPREALDGGPAGLDLIERLSHESLRAVRPGGLVAFEVGQGQAQAVASLWKKLGYSHIEVIPDLAGVPRVVVGRLGDTRADQGEARGASHEDEDRES